MTEGEPVAATLVAERTEFRSLRWVLLGFGVLGAVFLLASLVVWTTSGSTPSWNTIFLAIWFLVAAVADGAGETRDLTVSADGLRWRGPGWARSRPWSDYTEVGTVRPDLGGSGTWLAGRHSPGVPRASGWMSPRRMTLSDKTARPYELTVFAQLTRPGQRRPAWSVPDEALVDAVRTHAGDRWVDDLRPGT